ncbi:SLBB domain-containing protein [Deefgea rivuli]|uniref:SLBB domain-containing protein n=1 Tax=Deefgea rivuli TaxID=400948 RepID=UPI00047FCB4A|nr:SLBB domain-containing protein [Deefgea rivuli]
MQGKNAVTAPVYNPLSEANKLRQRRDVPADTVHPCNPADAFFSPFQRLVCDSLGLSVPVYGQSLLSNDAANFAPGSDVQASADYPVGPGDELLLKVWGSVDLSSRLVVDRNGAVFIPSVGNIPVAGTPFAQLDHVIGKAIAVYYKDLKISISMGQLRTIPVYLTGMAKTPGRLMVNSNSTLLNAIMEAGGVGAQGSLRRLELRRMGQTVGTFDLYDLLLKGDKSKDLRLQSGDVIFIPPVGAQVALLGPVKQPAIYELKGGETAQDLLLLVGGESVLSKEGQVQLEQIKHRKARSAKVLAQSELATFKLTNGDILQWQPLAMKYEGVVNLRSSLGLALRAEWKPGMRISDLIPDVDFLLTPKYWEDRSKGLFNTAIKTAAQETQANTIRSQSGQEINWDYAAIQRRDPKTFENKLISFNLAKALKKDPANDIQLQADDIVTIFTRNDMRSPIGSLPKYVTVEGEVAVPGVYQIKSNETLQDVVQRAGGLTEDGWLFAAELTRLSVREQQRKSLDEMADELEANTTSMSASKLQNATGQTAALEAKGQTELGKGLVDRIRKTQPSGRIVLGLLPDALEEDLPDATLEDGDRFYVPRKATTVAVSGQVYNRNAAFLYSSKKTLADYLNMAGGYKEDANEDQVYVMRADGSIIGSNNRGWLSKTALSQNALPGDLLIVPQKIDKTTWVKDAMDWTQILSNFATGVAAINVLGY